MFGRDLAEQVRADSPPGFVPVIVEKCIDAVDFSGTFQCHSNHRTSFLMISPGLEYEGIYRKTGGSRLCKVITQLFERGDYDSFDLRDSEEFNDICSITSVLKSYFRSLPDPLLTYELHDRFIEATAIKEPALRSETVRALVSELPKEHYHTTRALMLHLHRCVTETSTAGPFLTSSAIRVSEKSEVNLMHARNLGVVFGRELDPYCSSDAIF